jgi:hypothetical protein
MNSLRTEKLRAFIKSPDTAVLIKNEINVGYFSGFHHSEGVFLLTSDKAYLHLILYNKQFLLSIEM